MASVHTSNYDILFATRDDALDTLEHAKEMATTYGQVTLACIRENAGLTYTYNDTETYWTLDALRHAGVAKLTGGYGIMLPPPSSYRSRVTYRSYTAKPTPKPSPRPLTITIDNSVDDLDEVLATVFKYVYTITDRDVTIDIT